ncbi:hypothetical protein V6N12_005686 [Hibiscus sabdariffa]|uniref:Pentatricopeptide repeat-containing protein n=1 Tax=Hibiscus sabdariffa TaxID=183260 RepID=A0ABR2BBD2_9ROSI
MDAIKLGGSLPLKPLLKLKRDASRLFWNMCQHPSKDAVTYTTIITAYCTIDNIVKAADLVYAKLEVWMLPALFCRS